MVEHDVADALAHFVVVVADVLIVRHSAPFDISLEYIDFGCLEWKLEL